LKGRHKFRIKQSDNVIIIMTKVNSERNEARPASWSAGAASADENGDGGATTKVSVEDESRSGPAAVAERYMSVVRESCGVARQCAARTWHRCNSTIAQAVA
jgi:hypothetical protein